MTEKNARVRVCANPAKTTTIVRTKTQWLTTTVIVPGQITLPATTTTASTTTTAVSTTTTAVSTTTPTTTTTPQCVSYYFSGGLDYNGTASESVSLPFDEPGGWQITADHGVGVSTQISIDGTVVAQGGAGAGSSAGGLNVPGGTHSLQITVTGPAEWVISIDDAASSGCRPG